MYLEDLDPSKLPPLERYFRILEMLAACPDGLAVTEIGKVLMLPKATAYRLLVALQRSDLVAATNGGRARFQLADRVKRLAYLSVGSDALVSLTRSVLEDFSKQSGETCYLCRLEGTIVRSIAVASPEATWRGYVLPGRELRSYATAGAKAIMAFQTPELIERALSSGIAALTKYTKTDRAAILKEYESIRKTKFATCIKEVEEEVAAFAVPITLDPLGVQYSVGVMGPYSRIAKLIKGTARQDLTRVGMAIEVILQKSLVGSLGLSLRGVEVTDV